ncbi:MAG TPA: thiamine phosphate synthase [Kofleriaceae bacterium]
MPDPIRVVVITDRRLYGSEEIAGRIAAMLATAPRGSVAIQIREKDLDGGPLLRLVHEVIEVARPAGARVFVNDRLDVALTADADGVHLPEHGLSIEDARAAAAAIGRKIAIGCSRHTPDAVKTAAKQGAELVQFGPIWATPGKGTPLGVEPLNIKKLRAHLVAVGGIDGPARARQAALSGADAVAVIRVAWQGVPDVIGKLVEAVDAGVRAR